MVPTLYHVPRYWVEEEEEKEEKGEGKGKRKRMKAQLKGEARGWTISSLKHNLRTLEESHALSPVTRRCL